MIPAHSSVSLPEVRRLEAVSFRSWPAANTRYDKTWALRLTAGHPAKRLNSVNPLDPADHSDLDERIASAARLFQSHGRPLIFRHSPLAPVELENRLDARGWLRFDETHVMTMELDGYGIDEKIITLPCTDVGKWIDQSVAMESFSSDVKPGVSELIDNVQGEVGLFLKEDDDQPKAAAMAVRFDDLVGLFEIVSNPAARRKGYGRAIVRDALAWARSRGAKRAWLQVVVENNAAVELYQSIGFSEVYSYAYRRAPEGFHG